MAGSQIPTSVTILNSLHGFIALSINGLVTTSAPSICAGSIVEIAGAYFTFASDESINATSWTTISTGTTAYMACIPAGTAGSQTVTVEYTGTSPTWRDDFQGWYASAASNTRIIGDVYKTNSTSFTSKNIYNVTAQHQTPFSENYRMHGVQVVLATAGTSTWTVPSGVYRIMVSCVGGGGGGAGGFSATTYICGGGGGGGSVPWIVTSTISVYPGQVLNYTIGAGGAGGAGGANGAAGANTSFDGFGSAYGAYGAVCSLVGGGSSTTSEIFSVSGHSGQPGLRTSTNYINGGQGGGPLGGFGGANTVGLNGKLGSGGGGGAWSYIATWGGGDGGDGAIFIRY